MFLLILEDGEIMKIFSVSDDEKQAADDGMCDIIDISGPEPLCYYKGEWNEIKNSELSGE